MGAALLAALSGAASANDGEPCPKDLICASAPRTVADALLRAGYQGRIDSDGEGDPLILSSTAGYKFNVFFYDCKEHKECASLQLLVSITPSKPRDLAFVNKWNTDKRFGQLSLTKDGDLRLTHDFSTVGGVTRANFADTIEWWSSIVGTLDTFIAANPTGESKVTTPAPKPDKTGA